MTDDPVVRVLADPALTADLRAWRRAHPDATLSEIEHALDARLAPVRATVLAEVAADVPDDGGRCPECGGRLRPRGTRARTLRTAGDAELALTRPYPTCPACRTELSPLDERLGLLPGSLLTPWLAESLVRLGASVPFVHAADLVAHFTGVRVLGSSTAVPTHNRMAERVVDCRLPAELAARYH